MSNFDGPGYLHCRYITDLDISGFLNVYIAAFHYCGVCLPGWTTKKAAEIDPAWRQRVYDLLAAIRPGSDYADVLASHSHAVDYRSRLAADVYA
jgi:hypothetical protein